MPMFVGIGDSCPESETQSIYRQQLHHQQPSPFFNGNPSSRIWGSPQTPPPLWRQPPRVSASAFSFESFNVPPLSSASSAPFFPFDSSSTSSSFSSSSVSFGFTAENRQLGQRQPQGQGEEWRWQGTMVGRETVRTQNEEKKEEVEDGGRKVAGGVGAGSVRDGPEGESCRISATLFKGFKDAESRVPEIGSVKGFDSISTEKKHQGSTDSRFDDHVGGYGFRIGTSSTAGDLLRTWEQGPELEKADQSCSFSLDDVFHATSMKASAFDAVSKSTMDSSSSRATCNAAGSADSLGMKGIPLGGNLRRSQEVFIFGSSGGGPNSGRVDLSAPGTTARPQFVRTKKHFRTTKMKAVGNTRPGPSLSHFANPSVSTSSRTTSESFQPGTSNSLNTSDQEYSFVPPSRFPNTNTTWVQVDNLSNMNSYYSPSGDFQSRNCKGQPRNGQEEDSTIQALEQQFSSWKPLSNKHDGHGVAKNGEMVQVKHSSDNFMTFRLETASDSNGVASSGYANKGEMHDSGKNFTPIVDGVGVSLSSNLSGVFNGSRGPKPPEGSTHKSSMPCSEACRLDSHSVSLAPEEDTEQFQGYDTLLHRFSKIGNTEGPSNTQQENQERVGKQSREPFIFGASSAKPSSVPNVSSGKMLSGLCAPDSSVNSLDSMGFKSGLDRFENVNRTEAHVPVVSETNTCYHDAHMFVETKSAAPLFNPGVKMGITAVNNVKTIPQLGSLSFPFIFSAGSGSDSSSFSKSFEAIQSGLVPDGGPLGEFAHPPSSSETSASENSPTGVGDQGMGTHTPFTPNLAFEFQCKNKVSVKHSIPRRKNERAHHVLPNCRRRMRCSMSKGRRNETGWGRSYVPVTRTPDAVGSPMDFSPCFDAKPEVAPPLGGNFSMPNLEQPSIFWGNTVLHVDSEEYGYRDAWESIINEDPKVEELRTEAANLNIGDEQGGDKEEPAVEDLRVAAAVFNIEDKEESDLDNASCESSKDGTGQHFCQINIDTSVPKSGSYKEGENTFAQVKGNSSNSVKEGIEDKSGLHGNIAHNFTVDCQSRHFTFTSSSSGNLSNGLYRRHARRFRHRRPVGSMPDVKTATSKREVDSSPSKCDYETSNNVGLGDVPGGVPTSVSQGISVDLLRQTGISTTENSMTKDIKEGNLFQTSAHKAETNKVRPVFTSRITYSLPTDSPVQSVGNSLHLRTGMPASPSATKSAAAEKLCEQWRLRGNQAYANGDFPKAEEYYSRGANSVPPDETSQSCIRAAMLCYSNRAATRMAVGRVREALADCLSAMSVDPKFLRVRLRAASCHLALGESKAAASLFKECVRLLNEGDKPEPKIATESLEGLKKSEQLDEYSVRALEILENGNATDAAAALHLLSEALLISPHSEHLLEMKVQVLLSLRKYEEVVQLCEQSLVSAERNHPGVENEHMVDTGHDRGNKAFTGGGNSSLKLWRWRLSAKALFLMGRLKESLDLITRCQEIISDKSVSIEGSNTESLSLLMTSICDLLHHKAAGNEAFQAGRHAEAIEHYTAALACNGESRAFNAVCFCNRAAASQALGHIADAIADCSIAIALDPDYLKAISRRATLHEMVRDYGHAYHDLRKLVSLLENRQQQGTGVSQAGKSGDLKQACNRLARAEEEMKKGHPPDHYLILGVDMSCSTSDIKKAYRKAALKHHPDKAGQLSVRGENGDDGRVWKEVGDDVRRDAECLFKMIGEAYAILSDSVKRLRYDTDEEIRKRKTRGGSGAMPGTELHRSQYEKGTRRHRERWDSWNDYSHQYQRWQSGPDAAQQDTYSRRGSYASKNFKSNGDTCRGTDNDWYEV